MPGAQVSMRKTRETRMGRQALAARDRPRRRCWQHDRQRHAGAGEGGQAHVPLAEDLDGAAPEAKLYAPSEAGRESPAGLRRRLSV